MSAKEQKKIEGFLAKYDFGHKTLDAYIAAMYVCPRCKVDGEVLLKGRYCGNCSNAIERLAEDG